MRPFIVALWSFNTQAMQHIGLDMRMTWMQEAVERAFEVAIQQLGRVQYSLSEKPLGLFVAPEYFIAQPVAGGHHGPDSRRHIEEDEKERHLTRFKQMSETCKGLVIIPGTIAWRKPLLRSGPKLLHSKGRLAGQAKTVSRQEKAVQAVKYYAERQKMQLARPLSGPLHTPLGPRPALTTQQKLDALEQAGPLLNLSDVQFLARNTAYVLYNGDVKLKYNKQGDFHEVLDGMKTIHIPGKLDGRFNIYNDDHSRRIDFGIEICLDHVFQTTGKEIPHLGEVDIHVISSAQVSEREEFVAVRDGGYLVHACSNDNYTGVRQLNRRLFGGKSLDVEKPFEEEELNGAPLKFWQIDLDLIKRG